MLKRIFRFGKTLFCSSTSVLYGAADRILSDPIELSFLLNRLEYSNSPYSRSQNHVRTGSTVVLQKTPTSERLTLQIAKDENTQSTAGIVPVTSTIGAALLGLGCGEVVHVRTPSGDLKWELVSVDNRCA